MLKTFQPLIVIYRRDNLVYNHCGCTSIYWPLSYPFRSLELITKIILHSSGWKILIKKTLRKKLLRSSIRLLRRRPTPALSANLVKFIRWFRTCSQPYYPYNKVKTSFLSPKMLKAWSKQTGFNLMIAHFFITGYNTGLDIIFLYGWELVQIYHIFIGFKVIHENLFHQSIL